MMILNSLIKPNILTDGAVRFSARWAILTKIGWVILAAIVSVSVILGLPYGYRSLTQTCTSPCYIIGQLTSANASDLQRVRISLETYALAYSAAFAFFTLLCLGVSALLVWKKPGEFMPFSAAYIFLGLITVEGGFVFYSDLFKDNSVLGAGFNILGLFDLTAYLFLTFPSGKFKARIYLWLFLCLLTANFGANLTTNFFASPGTVPDPVTKLIISLAPVPLILGIGFFFEKNPQERKLRKFLFYLLICLVTVAAASMILNVVIYFVVLIFRYFQVLTPRERRSTKWLIYGFVLWLSSGLSVEILPILFPDLNAPGSYYFVLYNLFGFFGCTINLVGLLMAILYGNAFDIDIIINRTLVYLLLSACVVGLFALFVLAANTLFQVETNNLGVSLGATVLIAVLFQPLRLGLQRSVNRLLYGRRDEPYSVLAHLGQQLETIYQPEAVLPQLVNTIAASLKLPFVAIILAGQEKLISAKGENTTALTGPGPGPGSQMVPVRLPLSYQGEIVGELLVSPRRGEERLSGRDFKLLQNLARQAGVVGYSLRLLEDLKQANSGLQTANVDLRRAREKLVLAREEERRRLRRDLHDGLAPALAGLALSADALTRLIELDPSKARQKSQELYSSIRHSVGDVRRIAHELRPPILDEFGLVAALNERARQFSAGELVVELKAPPALTPLPAAVEVAAYRVAQEALMNVVRHAMARHCLIHMVIVNQPSNHNHVLANLMVEVSDDGRGMPATGSGGVGLRSMREQAEELGGTFTIESPSQGGTLVRLILPFEVKGAV